MKHSILRKLMLIAVLLTGSHAFAHDFEVNGIYYNKTYYDGYVEVSFKGNNPMQYNNEYYGDIVIPDSVVYQGKTYIVSRINSAFAFCGDLSTVKLPNTITSITSMSFAGCTNLDSISIPNSVKYIGRQAFDGTKWYNTQENGILYMNDWCLGYKGENPNGELVIKEGTQFIAGYGFQECDLLTSIIIPNSVKGIGDGSFYRCNGITKLTYNALNCLTYDDMGDADGYIFSSEGNNSLTNINIAGNIESIPNGMLYNCIELTSITIPNSVTSIGKKAFASCTGLTSITIPKSVKYIGDEALGACSNLSEITGKCTTPPTATLITYVDTYQTATLYVPVGCKEIYASADGWKEFTNIVEMEFENETETTITIMDATNQGSVSFNYEEGKAFDFTVTPVTGYIVNTVLVNGEICEAEDGVYNIESVSEKTTISVSYELDPETGVSTLSINNIKVYGCDNTLTVTGVEFGDKISVYDLNGTQIYTQNSVGYTNSISLNNNGVYIVKVNGKSFKVML